MIIFLWNQVLYDQLVYIPDDKCSSYLHRPKCKAGWRLAGSCQGPPPVQPMRAQTLAWDIKQLLPMIKHA